MFAPLTRFIARCGALAAYFFLGLQSNGSEKDDLIALFALFLYIGGFALGMGALPWIIQGEVLPLRVRAVASSVAVASNWATSFCVTQSCTCS